MGQRARNNDCGSRLLYNVCLGIVAGGIAFLSLSLASTDAAPGARAIAFRLDHFQCYRVDPTSAFKPRSVTLADQFGRSKAVATKLVSLCAPVRKNRVLVRNRLAHLSCYALRSTTFRARRVVVTNQFEKAGRLVVVRPTELCLPSGKRLLPGPAPRPVKGLDHYQCYAVKPLTQFRARRPLLVDQFGKSRPVVARPVRLCAPVRKNGGIVRNPLDHLVCYQLRPTQAFRVRRALIVNQFGRATLVVVRPDWLCLPSRKRQIVLPDLTVAIANTPTQVSCPGGAGTCLTTVSFTITNASTTAITTSFQVLIEADPAQTKTVTVAGLAAGASQTFSEQLGPDGNCYDPDCSVRVTADSGNVITESNEANNVALRTDLG